MENMGHKRNSKPTLPRRAQMMLDRAYEVCRVFGLLEFPRDMPFATDIGLDLPDRPLTAREIGVIGAAAAGPLYENTSWHMGDLLLYLQKHPDAPVSYDAVVSRCQRVKFKPQTLANYKSVAHSFPFAQRHSGLPWRMHEIVRALPRAQRDRLLDRALRENLSPKEVELLRKTALGATRDEIIVAKLENEFRHLHSARRDRTSVLEAIDRCKALLDELREIVLAKH